MLPTWKDALEGDIAPDLVRLLRSYSWPGNIRQLAHAMEAAVLHAGGGRVVAADIPPRILRRTADAPSGRYSFFGTQAEERARIESALRGHRGNLTRTARSLGMSRNTLRARLAGLGIGAGHPSAATAENGPES